MEHISVKIVTIGKSGTEVLVEFATNMPFSYTIGQLVNIENHDIEPNTHIMGKVTDVFYTHIKTNGCVVSEIMVLIKM